MYAFYGVNIKCLTLLSEQMHKGFLEIPITDRGQVNPMGLLSLSIDMAGRISDIQDFVCM